MCASDARQKAAPDGYEGRIGRYGGELADALIAVAGISGGRALDVGCGSGALTTRLAALLGAGEVAAVDPSPESVAACVARVPGAEVRLGSAEALPWPTGRFDAVLGQLVVGFLQDPAQAVSEMRRVARPGAPVVTCAWDFRGGMTVLRTFWDAALAVDPALAARHDQAATHRNSSPEALEGLWEAAQLRDVSTGQLEVGAGYEDFEDLWRPLVLPDGAPGKFFALLDPGRRRALEQDVRRRLGSPRGAFRLAARAWYALGYA